jgi:asparagine synthase (glutamine-hydrolysing)
MCGITGFVNFSSGVDRAVLAEMLGQIRYRGPDSSGTFISENGEATLGIRRLSIIDLKTGDQPIKNEDGNVTVVYNGEIYNYKDLVGHLTGKGHKFKTKSDTEVLVHLYEEYGDNLAKHLNGMFAFAIWDEKNKKLILSRDRSGIKPLYYFRRGKSLVFGSEVKTILKNPLYNRQIEKNALSFYFYLWFFPGGITIFKDICKVLPGHTVIFSKGGLTEKQYFTLSPEREYEGEGLDELLFKSVKSQLQSDVPVGVLLSGGLDSSLIAYYISKIKKLKSFSISFKNPKYDESQHAEYVAKKLGTDHYSEEFSVKDVVPIFSEISKNLDEPFFDPSLLPTYKVSRFARKYVKVVLSGDGGDELFGGYPTYQASILANYFKFIPSSFFDSLGKSLDLLPDAVFDIFPTSFKDYSKKRLAKIVIDGMKKKGFERHLYLMRTFFLGEGYLFKYPDMNVLKNTLPDYERIKSPSLASQYVDFCTYLRDDFLFKADRASMYNSLELRVPFLDNSVIDFAFSAGKRHVSLLKTKIMLRDLLKKKLPDTASLPKKGFGIPLSDWLKDALSDFGMSLVSNKKLYDFVDRRSIKKIWEDHQAGKQNYSGPIWQIMVFSSWLNNWY